MILQKNVENGEYVLVSLGLFRAPPGEVFLVSVLRSSNFAAWNFHKYREEHFVASFRTLYDNKLIRVHAAARKVPHHPQYRNNLDVQSICEHNHFITLF